MSPVLGAIFAILIGLLSVPSLITWQTQAKDNVNAATVAQQARQVIQASNQYIQTNAATLQATATNSTRVTVSIAQLQAAGLLPSAFKPTNLYNQTWQLEVLQPTAGNLQSMITTTGGAAISDTQAMHIARLIGYEGGFYPKNDTGQYPGGNSNAYGSSWGPLSAAGYTNQAGHLALLINFNNGQLNDNRLYRNRIPGQPQLNTMNTPIIMASTQTVGADCTSAGVGAFAQDGAGRLVSCNLADMKWHFQGSAYWQDPVANFATLTTSYPCNAATAWQTRIVEATSVGGRSAGYICNGMSWQPLAVDDAGNLAVPGLLTAGKINLLKSANDGDPCSPATDGNMAMTSTGLQMTCWLSDHKWHRVSGIIPGGGKAQLWMAIAGQQISCYSAWGSTIFAKVDSNGTYYLRVYDPSNSPSDTGWVVANMLDFAGVEATVDLSGLNAYYGMNSGNNCHALWN